MLHVEDVSGAVSSEFKRSLRNDTGCGSIRSLFNKARSYREGYPDSTSYIQLEDGVLVQESLIYDASYSDLLRDFHRAIDECQKINPLEYYSDLESAEVSEVMEFIDASELPEGVVGYTSVVTKVETGEKRTVQRIFLRFDHEGEKGLMYLSVTNPSGEPADLSPMDLIDPALRKAEGTLDDTGLGSLTSSPAPATADASEESSAAGSPTQSGE